MIAPLQTQWVDDFPDDLLLYPDSDGKPMAENTEQYRWIVTIKENLELRFRHNADVFIAADLFWYSVERTVSPWVPPPISWWSLVVPRVAAVPIASGAKPVLHHRLCLKSFLQLRQMARSLRQQGMTLAQISQLTGLSADQLAELNLD